MISVIISTFNRSGRLKKAIQSVLNQTYPDFELIIVDDNSKDDTEKVVKSFKDKRIGYIKRTKNSGTDARPKNQGIMASKGEYIAFLDDDNEFRPDHLMALYNELTRISPIPYVTQQITTLDVVYGDRWLTDETGRIKPQLGISMEFDPTYLMQRNFIDTSDVLIKRQTLFDVGGLDERWHKYLDWNLWVRMCKAGKKFKRVPLILTDYHLHAKMRSTNYKTKGETNTTFVPEWDPYDVEVVLPNLGNTLRIPRVAIYSITYDRLAYTKKSFKSLNETAGYPFDHFVVDNGSTDETVVWLLSKIDTERMVLNKSNYGISKASNQAIDLIKKNIYTPINGDYDIIVKWDNDCIGLTKGWLAKMVEVWQSNHMMALSCYVQGLRDNPGGAPRLGFGTVKGEMVGVTKHLGGICHFVDAKVYDSFRWDENSFLHGVQDMEMSQYLQYHGYSMGYLENFMVSHGPLGTESQKKDFPSYFERRTIEKQTRYDKNG
jgi:glycosyltransferase involved in cell wall biosynthesis